MQELACPLYYEQTVIWSPPNRPMSVELVEEALDNVSMDILFVAPSILEEMSQSQASLEKLRKVKSVETGGGKRESLISTQCSNAQ